MPSMTLTCRICNLPMQRARTSKPQGEAAHIKCRDVHGSPGRYSKGCRCDLCRLGKKSQNREANDRFKEKHGISPTNSFRLKFKEATGRSYWRGKSTKDWIHPDSRWALYERDSFKCHICEETLDPDGDPNGIRALTLDHLIPRSKGGSDEPDNLSTACRMCNSTRRDAPLMASH